jgi:hypothetical protein
MRSIIALHTAPSIPGGSKPWVRARRASLGLLPQRPRHNERRTGAHVHCTRARPQPWRADAQCEGRWASWVLVLSRAAFVLSRATRSAISSMRASSCGALLAYAQKLSVAESAGQGAGAGHCVCRRLLRRSAVSAVRAAMPLVPVSGLCGIVWLLRGPRKSFLRTWFTTSNLSLYQRISHGDT